MKKFALNRGFSALEVLVVLTISAALCLASLNTLPLITANRLRLESRRVELLARQGIISSQGSDGETIIETDSPGEISLILNHSEPVRAKLSHDTHIQISSTLPNKLRLFEGGVSSPASLKLSKGEAICTVNVSLRGRTSRYCESSRDPK